MNKSTEWKHNYYNFVGFSSAVLHVICLLVEWIDCQNMCCVKLLIFKLLSLVCRKLRFEWKCFIETIHFFPSINFARIMEENRAHLKPGVSHRFTASTALISLKIARKITLVNTERLLRIGKRFSVEFVDFRNKGTFWESSWIKKKKQLVYRYFECCSRSFLGRIK